MEAEGDATALRVRRPEAGDRAGWDRLYAGYAEFYGVVQTPQMRDRVWGWLQDPAHGTEGLVAEAGGRLIGLAHFRAYDRPLAASTGGFLDDLFVEPEARGRRVSDALIGVVAGIGRQRGWTVLRWITAEDNAQARKVYDRIAERTPWVTYELKLS